MQSIKTIYKIGPGPSSSHTFGPMMASKYINEHYPDASHFKITLFGSLALTGKGHLTDKIILKTLGASKCEIIFDMKTPVEHPNTMIIEVFDNDTKIAQHTFVSIGGGKIEIDGKKGNVDPEIYPHTKMDDIQVYCNERHLRLDQYIDEVEGSDFDSYMNQIFKQMLKTVNTGLKKTGVLPGSLKIDRVAHALYQSAQSCSDIQDKNSLLLSSYAYAANEQNASGGIVVTAPTMGSCGVLPSLS